MKKMEKEKARLRKMRKRLGKKAMEAKEEKEKEAAKRKKEGKSTDKEAKAEVSRLRLLGYSLPLLALPSVPSPSRRTHPPLASLPPPLLAQARAAKKQAKRDAKAKKRLAKKIPPITEVAQIVDHSSISAWLAHVYSLRQKGEAVPVPYYIPEAADGKLKTTSRQVRKAKRLADEASAFKIKTLGVMGSQAPTEDMRLFMKGFADEYAAAATDRRGPSEWLNLWAPESGLRWHMPFGAPANDGMDKIRAAALKKLEMVVTTQGISKMKTTNAMT